MRVRSKLLAGLGVLLSLVVLASVMSLWRTAELVAVNERVRHSHGQLEAALGVARALDECAAFAVLSSARVVAACAGAEREASELVRATAAERRFVEERGEGEDIEHEAAAIGALYVQVQTTGGRLARAASRGDASAPAEAAAIVRSHEYAAIRAGLERAVKGEKAEVERAEAAGARSAASSARVAWACLVAAVLTAIAAASWILPRLLRSLDELLRATRRVAAGDLAHRARLAGDDELAELGAAFDGMVAELEQARSRNAEVEALARQSSRRAGRAEVAAGVLHDVGNALNSVVVSSSLLAEAFDQSRLDRFPDSVGLLRRRDAELGGALAKDERGGRLIAYLEKLAERWSEETRRYRRTLAETRAGIDHVARVVGKQQEYATQGGVSEPSSLREVIEDALVLTRHALEKNGIALELAHAEPDVTIVVDRHCMVEILVNLVNNARDALRASPEPRKIVRVSSSADERELRIAVSDNGLGVEPEHRARLFERGFTTKHDGHGFGLHNGAQLSAELGGTLTFAEPERGPGATFVLTIPSARLAQAPRAVAAGAGEVLYGAPEPAHPRAT